MSEARCGDEEYRPSRVAIEVTVIVLVLVGLFGMLGFGVHRLFRGLEESTPGEEKLVAQVEGHIASLVERLGHVRWEERVSAQKRLLELGRSALAALREALDHPDAEVVWRIEETIERIEASLPQESR